MWSRGLASLCSWSNLTCTLGSSLQRSRVFVQVQRPTLSALVYLRGNVGDLGGIVATKAMEQVAGLATSAVSAAASAAGSLKRKQQKKVGTHNGTFHCDEALGCFMIRMTEKFGEAEIVRTRDQKILDTLDAVLDVGGVYNPEADRYDHHQRGFDQVFGHGFATKLSSAGLVYKHYGEEIVAKELGLDPQHPDVQRVYLAVYKSFMEAIDAVDNGINQYDTNAPPKYANDTYLSARVGRLNPDWMDENSPEKEDQAFHQAMELAGKEFLDSLRYYGRSWLPARSIVAESLAARKDAHESGEIMILKQFCPWKQHLFELEQEFQLNPTVKYVVYQDERSGSWRVQAVAVSPGMFESRKALPVPWRGLRDEQLSKVAGIEGCVFVHMSGFIGGANSFQGTMEMARKALEFSEAVEMKH
ncbi:hypothetical protein R1flu_028010 [Riccia fluitans]|uniref:Metal-dependent protein hydrolase n=1 Tax=Riccia fluitans TaxID=41844 RepID=A0ABD1XKH0_9MARC